MFFSIGGFFAHKNHDFPKFPERRRRPLSPPKKDRAGWAEKFPFGPACEKGRISRLRRKNRPFLPLSPNSLFHRPYYTPSPRKCQNAMFFQSSRGSSAGRPPPRREKSFGAPEAPVVPSCRFPSQPDNNEPVRLLRHNECVAGTHRGTFRNFLKAPLLFFIKLQLFRRASLDRYPQQRNSPSKTQLPPKLACTNFEENFP